MSTDQNHDQVRDSTILTNPLSSRGRVLNKATVSTQAEFERIAISIHGNKYDYSYSEYNGLYNKVEIKCVKHGSFWQLPIYHLKGCGCKKCGHSDHGNILSSYNRTHNICLYLVECSQGQEIFYKLGLTTVGTVKRFIGIPYQVITLLECNLPNYQIARSVESFLLEYYKDFVYQPTKPFGGSSRETFLFNDINEIITSIESFVKVYK